MAVTLALATHDASLPVAYRRYLAEDWAQDDARRHKAQIPQTIAVQTKPEIALEQIKAAQTAGLPQGILPQGMGLMDAGDGHDPRFRTEHRSGYERCGRGWSQHLGRVAERGAQAAAAAIGVRTTTEAASTRCAAPADLGQSTRPQLAGRGVANHHLARGSRGLALVALCPAPRAAGASR